MTTNEVYVSLEIAKLLKKVGFDLEVDKFYWYDRQQKKYFLTTLRNGEQPKSNEYLAPSLAIAQRWLRDVKNIDIEIHALVGMLHVKVYVPYISTYRPYVVTESDKHFGITEEEAKEKNWLVQTQFALTYDNDRYPELPAHKYFHTYEEAQQEAIMKTLKTLAIQIK